MYAPGEIEVFRINLNNGIIELWLLFLSFIIIGKKGFKK